MAKIYDPPKSLPVPEFNFADRRKTEEQEDTFLKMISEWCKANSNDTENADYIGSLFRIPMADGYAQYAVLSLKPVKLVHLPIGDAWDSIFARTVTAGMIKAEVDGAKRVEELFPKATRTRR